LEAQIRKDNQMIVDSGIKADVEVMPHSEINQLEVSKKLFFIFINNIF